MLLHVSWVFLSMYVTDMAQSLMFANDRQNTRGYDVVMQDGISS